MFIFPKPHPWPLLQMLAMLPPLVFFSHVFVGKLFPQKQQGESCKGYTLVRSVEESETSTYLIHYIVNINQLLILLPLLAILKICLSLAPLHSTQLLILLLCLVFLNITTQMDGLFRTRVHLAVV